MYSCRGGGEIPLEIMIQPRYSQTLEVLKGIGKLLNKTRLLVDLFIHLFQLVKRDATNLSVLWGKIM